MSSYGILATIQDQANPNIRYVVRYDDCAEDPRKEWAGMDVRYVEFKSRGWRWFVCEGNDDDALQIASTMDWALDADAPEVAEAICKHYRRAGLDVYDGDVWTGWCGRNIKSRYIVAAPYDARAAVAEFEEWAEGLVYMVTTQTRHVWHDDAGAEMVTWDDVDTIGGIYGLDYDDAEEVAYYAA